MLIASSQSAARDLLERLVRPAHPGIVDEHIEPAERLRRLLDDALALLDPRKIARHRHDPVARLETRERRLHRFVARPVDRDACPRLEKRLDRLLADPARPAGDQHAPAFKVHLVAPSTSSTKSTSSTSSPGTSFLKPIFVPARSPPRTAIPP